MEIIFLLALGGIGYFLYMKSKKKGGETKEPLFALKKGSAIDFFDNLLLNNVPLKDFNILDNGPYEVVGVNRTTSTIEYTMRGGTANAVLEVEKRGGRTIILIQTELANYPSLLSEVRSAWREDTPKFELRGLTYYLVGDGEEEDDGEECYYWDYYSDPLEEGYKVFIGVQDYGDEGKPELEFYMGFELPERSIKEIIPS